jgi:hypothetical protein
MQKAAANFSLCQKYLGDEKILCRFLCALVGRKRLLSHNRKSVDLKAGLRILN